MDNLSPIILFVYSRLWHTQQTIEALQKNELAKESEPFIYSDAPKNSEAQRDVAEIREYIKSINGFKKVTIVERGKNWGLATWVDRWQYYERDVDKTMAQFSRSEIKRFNLDGIENFWGQVLLNKQGVIHTWAIFWYATIFKHGGLCLNPTQTSVENIGHDGSGIHCTNIKNYEDNVHHTYGISFSSLDNESIAYIERIKKYLNVSILTKIKRVLNSIKIF